MPDTPDPAAWRAVLSDVSARLQQPADSLRRLLQDVLARAVAAVGAAEGSVLVPDEGDQLRFAVAHSPVADRLVGMRVPVAGSIAGYVFGTGQMMAIGDVAEEGSSQYYAEIDRQVGIATRTYLVVPILFGHQAAGVATYVNRPGAPPYQPFQPHEMQQARDFAAVEAVLLRQLDAARALAQAAAADLAALGTTADAPAAGGPAASWLQALLEMSHLPAEDRALCSDFIALLARHRSRKSDLA